MDPLQALMLALQAITISDGLLNAYIATQGALKASSAETVMGHIIALQEANNVLTAKIQAQLK